MNLLALLIALNSPLLDCDQFNELVWSNIVKRTVECDSMCRMILMDNPELITANVVSQSNYELYAKRTCVIYNRIAR